MSKNALSPIDNGSPGSSEGEGSIHSSSNRRNSSRGESGVDGKPPSRPSSRLSRKRTNSNATTISEKENTYQQRSRRRSVAGWASSAVESVANRMKKDKDTFATLDDEGGENGQQTQSLKKSMSIGSISRRSLYFSSSKANPQTPKQQNTTPGKKIVRAHLDYEAKSLNELSFQAGSDIVVLNEVLDSWWMGELNGLRGLFPTTHVELIDIPSLSLPSKADKSRTSDLIPKKEQQDEIDSDTQSLYDGYGSSELDDEQGLTSQPLEYIPFKEGLGDPHNIETLMTNNADHSTIPQTPKPKTHVFDTSLQLKSRSYSPPDPTLLSSNTFIGRSLSHSNAGSGTHTPVKKVPPPPPPRRANSNAPIVVPPLPERKVHTLGGSTRGSGFRSDTESLASYSGSTSGSGGERYDRSPFESVSDLSEVPARPGDRSDKTNPFQSVHLTW